MSQLDLRKEKKRKEKKRKEKAIIDAQTDSQAQ
jgi:hypothetical protein